MVLESMVVVIVLFVRETIALSWRSQVVINDTITVKTYKSLTKCLKTFFNGTIPESGWWEWLDADGGKHKIRKANMRSRLIPKQCCDVGTYDCQIPMSIGGRRYDIDICIADIVAALNAANIKTVASCCGHGRIDGVISLEDGREVIIKGVPGL